VFPEPALPATSFLRSIAASRVALDKAPMKLLDIVQRVNALTEGAPYAIVDGLAQILWARKTYTDDLDVALGSSVLHAAHESIESSRAEHNWSLPTPLDRAYESNDVFEVYHLLYAGAVVDLLSFRDMAFTNEILETAIAIPELGGLRFIRPELLIVTQFIRPDVRAAIAAIDLVAARQIKAGWTSSMQSIGLVSSVGKGGWKRHSNTSILSAVLREWSVSHNVSDQVCSTTSCPKAWFSSSSTRRKPARS